MSAIEPASADGSIGLATGVLAELYRRMLRIRLFEDRAAQLYRDGRIPGFLHLSVGQEAVAVGTCFALDADDVITSTHRGHGHVLAKGLDMREAFAELLGKETGSCRGRSAVARPRSDARHVPLGRSAGCGEPGCRRAHRRDTDQPRASLLAPSSHRRRGRTVIVGSPARVSARLDELASEVLQRRAAGQQP